MNSKISCPEVYCPKEGKKVPVWWCLGSFMQKKETCPNLIKATVIVAEDYAKVECNYKKDDK